MESSFFIMADALKQMEPNLRLDATDILRVFDVNRERIYSIAAKVYARGRRGTYDLNVDDVLIFYLAPSLTIPGRNMGRPAK
jgi:Protein of unknown function (DUF1488)